MKLDQKLALINQVAKNGEITTKEELAKLFDSKKQPVAYDGFEPSGRIHIAQGILRSMNVNRMTEAGCKFKMFVADWHAWANNKLGGDLAKIQTTGKYLIEVWKTAGMDLKNVEFVWASDLVKDDEYWKKVMNVARDTTLKRVLRTTQIMGRTESDSLSSAQIMYPCMQAADIFHLGVDITQLGMDQRKVNMLAREVGPKLGFWKPVVVSHHMLAGLQAPADGITELGSPKTITENGTMIHSKYTPLKYILRKVNEGKEEKLGIEVLDANDHTVYGGGKTCIITKDVNRVAMNFKVNNKPFQASVNWDKKTQNITLKELIGAEERAIAMKMSKSKPDTAIFMTDSAEEIARKLKKAHCPEKEASGNPVMEYMEYMIFPNNKTVKVERPEKFGVDLEFKTYEELEKTFKSGDLHPLDLKNTASRYINELVEPVRKHFEKNSKAKALKEEVESFQITR